MSANKTTPRPKSFSPQWSYQAFLSFLFLWPISPATTRCMITSMVGGGLAIRWSKRGELDAGGSRSSCMPISGMRSFSLSLSPDSGTRKDQSVAGAFYSICPFCADKSAWTSSEDEVGGTAFKQWWIAKVRQVVIPPQLGSWTSGEHG